MPNHKKFLTGTAFALALLTAALVAPASAQVGPPGGTIYANDMMFETVSTPTDLPNRGKFTTLYVLGDDLAPVSSAAPGDRGYHGGRWEVRPVTFTGISPMQFTNAMDLEAAAGRGDIEIGDVVKRFVCPLIRK
jgi:hypothetical protein